MQEHEYQFIDRKLDQCRREIAEAEIGNIDIKNKEYSTVGLRLNTLRKAFGGRVSINTEIMERSDDRVCIKAELFYNSTDNEQTKLSDGYAEKNRKDSFITKTSAVEFCQTTAVGRALAMLGLLGNHEIASANEMSISDDKTEKPKTTTLGKKESEDFDV